MFWLFPSLTRNVFIKPLDIDATTLVLIAIEVDKQGEVYGLLIAFIYQLFLLLKICKA